MSGSDRNAPGDGKFFRILSLDGGGIRGVFPAAFLARLEEHLEHPIGRCSGSSTACRRSKPNRRASTSSCARRSPVTSAVFSRPSASRCRPTSVRPRRLHPSIDGGRLRLRKTWC